MCAPLHSAQSLINSRLDFFATADRDRSKKRARERGRDGGKEMQKMRLRLPFCDLCALPHEFHVTGFQTTNVEEEEEEGGSTMGR